MDSQAFVESLSSNNDYMFIRPSVTDLKSAHEGYYGDCDCTIKLFPLGLRPLYGMNFRSTKAIATRIVHPIFSLCVHLILSSETRLSLQS